MEAKPNSFILEFPAQLHFKPVPEQGGERFKVMAYMNPVIPFQYSVSPRYELMTAGVRGFHYNRTPSLVGLYDNFIKEAAAGKYDLNPFVPGPHVDLQVGTGTVESPTAHVNTLEATKPVKPVETKPAEVKPKLEAVPPLAKTEAPIKADAPAPAQTTTPAKPDAPASA